MTNAFPVEKIQWRREWPWLAAFGLLAVAFTWPLAPRIGSQLAGDGGDGWQNLWNFEWIRRSILAGTNPFHTDALWHPDGATLVFQTFDLPDALWSMPLRAFLGPWAVYDLVVLATFSLSGASMYLLGRSTGASRPAAFLSGCAYTFSTFHFGHALGHLHILAMQWVPLYALCLWRVLEGAPRRTAIAGGWWLALCAYASWYHLFGAAFVTAGIVGVAIVRRRGELRSRIPGLATTFGVGAAIIAPLAIAVWRARSAEPVSGQHSAGTYSADLQSFWMPNASSAVSSLSSAWRSWSGNGAENATYLGYVLVAIVLAAAARKAPRVGTYLVVALVGVVFSLGPALRWSGHAITGEVLPYAWLVKWIPSLSFAGVPVRFAFAATFGLAAALAPAIDELSKRHGRRLVLALGAVAVLEHTPHAFVTSAFATPAPMQAWAKDETKFAVLDACRDMRPLWHQTVHGHPIMGGYLTRTPARLEAKLAADPVAGPLLAWDSPQHTESISAASLDLTFSEPVFPGSESSLFRLELRGILRVPDDGDYTFFVQSDDSAQLFVDAHRVVDNGGVHPVREVSSTVRLTRGLHAVSLRYAQDRGAALARAWWSGPAIPRRILGPEDVPEGFEGRTTFHRRDVRIPRAAALEHLRALSIAHVVVDRDESRYLLETQLGLKPAYEADGVRIYDVPR